MTTFRELEQRLDLRARLAAIVDEIDAGEAEDIARTIAEGALEELDELLEAEQRGVWLL